MIRSNIFKNALHFWPECLRCMHTKCIFVGICQFAFNARTMISSREYSYYFRLKFVEKLKSVLKSMESKIPEKILHIHTDLSLTHIKIPPECHQTSARLPPEFHQFSASAAARIPPDFRQNSTRLPPALPPEFRQTSARMPPEFRQNAASLSSNLLYLT